VPTFIVLGRLTAQAKRDQAKAQKSRDQLFAEFQSKGFRFTPYSTLGPYDVADIVEAPTEELMMKFLMAAGATGDIETTTLRAFGSKDAERIRSA
jgi:uncharacterized protein with GYD domain